MKLSNASPGVEGTFFFIDDDEDEDGKGDLTAGINLAFELFRLEFFPIMLSKASRVPNFSSSICVSIRFIFGLSLV